MKKLIAILAVLALICAGAMAETGLTQFTTTDMEGNTVTQDVFKEYDMTIVNIWATWCGYCIQEMPELAKLKSMLPENVNFITICDDAATEPELVNQILAASEANFQTLVANSEMVNQLLGEVVGFPSTYFLDKDGLPVGRAVVGVPSLTNAAEAYYELAKAAYQSMEG